MENRNGLEWILFKRSSYAKLFRLSAERTCRILVNVLRIWGYNLKLIKKGINKKDFKYFESIFVHLPTTFQYHWFYEKHTSFCYGSPGPIDFYGLRQQFRLCQ